MLLESDYSTSILCTVAVILVGWVAILKTEIGELKRTIRMLKAKLKTVNALVRDEVTVLSAQRLTSKGTPAQADDRSSSSTGSRTC